MEPKANQIMSCPYNPAHQIEHYRMHIHIQKCRKQHPNSGKVTCPFNATHIINEPELNHHVNTCPQRGMLDTQIYVVGDERRPVVAVAQSTSNDQCADDWEAEANHQAYKPDYSKMGPHVIQKIKGGTPSQRRRTRMEGIKQYRPKE